ncbi:hypothetical protein DUNSADRAFT_16960 [Dunaliella salina]|uniref:Uncharacterized protein n=1 Tax=Dunaliella salina TaxID=3046 RepID=A0ABQ7G2Q2_DUNSA|nr:hypothetical protein DUNSADRAFT_16960 [Dunaliella salina]KAF5828874.1 hypothetical protein DUNSADRAFT_16960 [Dunaliella salina]|eukprot:KAF5828873.1 hypothetical protein DUNSADRAFT_16960 [Dunaliella salina]
MDHSEEFFAAQLLDLGNADRQAKAVASYEGTDKVVFWPPRPDNVGFNLLNSDEDTNGHWGMNWPVKVLSSKGNSYTVQYDNGECSMAIVFFPFHPTECREQIAAGKIRRYRVWKGGEWRLIHPKCWKAFDRWRGTTIMQPIDLKSIREDELPQALACKFGCARCRYAGVGCLSCDFNRPNYRGIFQARLLPQLLPQLPTPEVHQVQPYQVGHKRPHADLAAEQQASEKRQVAQPQRLQRQSSRPHNRSVDTAAAAAAKARQQATEAQERLAVQEMKLEQELRTELQAQLERQLQAKLHDRLIQPRLNVALLENAALIAENTAAQAAREMELL